MIEKTETMIPDSKHSAVAEAEKAERQTESMENNIASVATDEEIFFAKQRYKLHLATPDDGVSEDVLKNYFFKKYGF